MKIKICPPIKPLVKHFSVSGDGCVDKPLSTLWRNHISSEKPDILMKMTVVGSGLRAVTKEHGLTEYWANRITFCAAHPSYPRVFCWIYRWATRHVSLSLSACRFILWILKY